jgi:hypothetical protein
MRKKAGIIWTRYPGLRLLRSLALGYHMAPLRGFKWMAKSFLQGSADIDKKFAGKNFCP